MGLGRSKRKRGCGWNWISNYIYDEGCLSVRNACGPCNSWHHQTSHGTYLGPGKVDKVLAGQRAKWVRIESEG